MNVVVVPHYFGGLSQGGAELQAIKTADALASLGVRVRFHEPFGHPKDADIVHFIGSYPYFEDMARWVSQRGMKVVVSPVFWPPAAPVLQAWKRRLWFRYGPWVPILRRLPESALARLLRGADLLLPSSRAEGSLLTDLFRVSPRRIIVVPNGVESRFALASPDMFRSRVRDDEFLLSVGNIGYRKNQLRIIRASLRLGKPLVLIGRILDEDYAQLCRRAAGDHVQFLGEVAHDSELLASAYAAARVFVLASLSETPGLAALEAALAGTRVVVTSAGSACEYLGRYAWYCDPLDEDDIVRKVAEAWDSPVAVSEQRAHVMRFTWENVGRLTLEAYHRVLGERE